jgi:ABC-type amino acid transport substrate-binding protein
MIGFIFAMAGCTGCGEKKREIPSAAESMKKYNAVRIATYAVSPPFEFGKDAGVQGFDVDIGNEIGKPLGYEVKWVKALAGYDQLFDYLRNGEVEMVLSAAAIDPRLAKEFSFSHPYYDSWDILAIQSGKLEIKGLENLAGKTVGVATGRPADALISSRKDIKEKKFANLDEALGALNRAEIDAVVGDEPFLTYSSITSFANTMTRREKINTYPYAVVVRNNEKELLGKVNETIDRMKASGEIDELFKKWIGDKRTIAEKKINDAVKFAELKASPKTIKVTINKTGGDWDPDNLDGFKLVLQSATQEYKSTGILMNGNKGHCEFTTSVPPGDYTLNVSRLRMSARVPIPPLPKTGLAMELNIGREASILIR